MKQRIAAKLVGLVLLSALFAAGGSVRAQEPEPSSSPAPETVAKADQPVAKSEPSEEPQAAPAPTPETDFWKREEMTGAWGGDRTRAKEKGYEFNFLWVNFYQGVVDGGLRTTSQYNGKFMSDFKFDLGKIWGWKFWSARVKTETRFGPPTINAVGSIGPINTDALVPGTAGGVFAVTSFNLTKLIPLDLKKGDMVAVQFGRFNTLDLVDEDFFAGAGRERFLNIAQNGPLTVARTTPFITNGALIAWIKGGQPFLTLAILDPNDHSTNAGLKDLFADGVSFTPGITLQSKFLKMTGSHTFGFSITTKAYTPFDQLQFIIPPGPPIVPLQAKRGSWNVNYTGRQYLVERGPRDGWGLFVSGSIADKNTSPIARYLTFGLGGNGLIKSRRTDEFGIAYGYTSLSSTLKNAIDPLNRLRVEHEFEAFYNFHLTPWLRLTGDLQVIRPTRTNAETAIVPGARMEVIF